MITYQDDVTPAQAEAWLHDLEQRVAQGLFKQRPVRKGAVRKYAQDMISGNWLITHEGIAWDTAGNLIDGQNRLHAVILAGKPVRFTITKNVPETAEKSSLRAMDVVGQGVPRNVWQALQISHGYTGNALEFASVARGVTRLVLGSPTRRIASPLQVSVSTAQTLYVLEKLNYRTPIERLASIVPSKTLRPSTLTAVWSWLWMVHPKKAEQFADDYGNLVNLGRGHPALTLHKYISTRALRRRARDLELLQMFANALKAAMDGEPLPSLRPSEEAHMWLLRLNWPHVEKITQAMTGETMPDEPTNPPTATPE
jgi:hypothetical protein